MGAVAQLDWTYTTDSVGNITEIEDDLDPTNNRSFRYKDYQYFLKCAFGPWSQDPSDCDSNPPTGDPLEWTYDAIGNRLTHKTTNPDRRTDTYTYRMNGSVRTPVLDEIQLGAPIMGTHTYTFDEAGSLELFDTGSTTVTLDVDEAARIASLIHGPDGPEVGLEYDGRSFLRVVTQIATAESNGLSTPETVIFEDDFESGDLSEWSSCVGGPDCGPLPPEDLVALYDSSGLLHGLLDDESGNQYVFYLSGRPVAQVADDGLPSVPVTYLTTDHLGAPIFASDSGGQELWQGGFTPFGNDYSGAQAAGIFLRLPGQWSDPIWEDATSGMPLYYNVHRWYEYGTGRYTKMDPVGHPDPLDFDESYYNLFEYAVQNPLSNIDPSGLITIPWGDLPTRCRKRWQNKILPRLTQPSDDCNRYFCTELGSDLPTLLNEALPFVVMRRGRGGSFTCGFRVPSPVPIGVGRSLSIRTGRSSFCGSTTEALHVVIHELGHFADCWNGDRFRDEGDGCGAEVACFGFSIGDNCRRLGYPTR